MFAALNKIVGAFVDGWSHAGLQRHCGSRCITVDKEVRAAVDEDKLDKMVEDSFPASDPITMY